jgi:hypothetical protein
MKADVKKLLSKFTAEGIKNGDLVVTFEVHRVRDINWGKKRNNPDEVAVITLGVNGGESGPCRIMCVGARRQQGIAKLLHESQS